MPSLFSKTYLEAPAGQTNSSRLRQRLAGYFVENLPNRSIGEDFFHEVVRECGCEFPRLGIDPNYSRFYLQSELRDILDAITIFAAILSRRAAEYSSFPQMAVTALEYKSLTRNWIQFCGRAMREEGVPFKVMDDGSVKRFVDTAFQETKDSIIASLADPRFNGARTCIEAAITSLMSVRPDGKSAIRSTFEGVETIFKVVTVDNKNLDSGNVERLLQPIVSKAHVGADAIAKGAAEQLVQSFKDWVNACHKYRHGHNEPEPVEPPLDLAVALVSGGLGFARWIAQF